MGELRTESFSRSIIKILKRLLPAIAEPTVTASSVSLAIVSEGMGKW
jgi:NAD(P)H-dependent FMN reductase